MTAVTRTPGFELSRVVERTFGAFGRNFLPFYAMALVLSGIPGLVTTALVTGNGGMTGLGMLNHPGLIPLIFAGWFVSAVTSFLLQGALVWGTVADLNGKRATWGELLRAGLAVLWPLFLIAVCLFVALCFGLILLIVPALIMLTAWAVAVPAEVIERRGVFGSFSRSAELTRGHRWTIFALILVLAIVGWIVSTVMSAFGMATMGARGMMALVQSGASTPEWMSYLGLQILVGCALKVLWAVGGSVLYYELRAAKEGIGPEALASVFD